MATFRGAPTLSISLSVSTTGWPGFQVDEAFGPLEYPTGQLQFGLLSDGFVTRKTQIETRVIPAQFANTQRGNRHNRDGNLGAAPRDGMGIGFDWFENIHVNPQRLDLGNVVSDITVSLELYNAYRVDQRTWVSFVNNAGAGITIANLPSLPTEIPNQSSFIVEVQISSDGPPTINGTLDFVFDVVITSVPITGTRIILFGFPPSTPVTERLSWLTDIMKASDGTEQRLSLRANPRQQISYDVLTQRDIDRNQLNSFLFDWHSRVFGVPLWWDMRAVDQNVLIGDTAIHVVTTQWADFRPGGLAVIMAFDVDGNMTADTLEIVAVNVSPSTVEFTSGTANAYAAGHAALIPVVPGVLGAGIPKQRFPATQQQTTVSFQSLDNDSTTIAPDASGFNRFNDKTVIDDKNSMGKKLPESYHKKITRIDGDTGQIQQVSTEDRSTPTSRKGWNVDSAKRLWEIKSMLFSLYGKQVSFFMPTFNKDMQLVADVSIGGGTLDVENIGYTRFIKTRQPFATIAVQLKDDAQITAPSPNPMGSPPSWVDGQNYVYFDVISSVEISSAVERIVISPGAPIGFSVDDVERIEFIVRSRLDSDAVEFTHRWTDSLGEQIDTELSVPLSGVHDE
jgi:hypothetical protein